MNNRIKGDVGSVKEWRGASANIPTHLMSFQRDRKGLDDWLQAHTNIVAGSIVGAGFLVRVWAASGTYLNPDEAMHFMVANRDSLMLAYQASLNLAHPPLLILILYFLRGFGSSELVLRSPSILAGTAFCWVGFKWLGMLFDRTVALVGLIFFAFLPSMIGLSTEVRQYALLLFFCASGGYFLEKAFAENSVWLMIASAVSVYFAMLSHYSAFLFLAALGGYAILRMVKRHPSVRALTAWIVGQFGGLGVAVFLYKTQLSKLGTVGSGASTEGQDFYLRNSYFDSSHMNALHFMFARTGGVFQYVFSQLAVGDLAFLFFPIGVVILWRDRRLGYSQSVETGGRGWLMASLLTLPFVITCAAALMGKYPYGGTRHDAFLIPFAIAGVSVAVARLMRRRLFPATAAAVVIVAICNLFPSHRQPYISRADQSKAEMSESVKFIRSQVSSSDVVFSDFQSRLLLGHYLCDQRIVSYDKSIPEFISAECSGVRMIATTASTFVFSPKTFLQNWNDMVVAFGLKPGDKVWVVQEGWNVRLPDELKKLQAFRNLDIHFFRQNIATFELSVGQPFPNFDSLASRMGHYFSPSALRVPSSGTALPFVLVTTPKPPL